MKCRVCDKETSKTNYCELHSKAYENVARKYGQWKEASGLSWKEYLSEVAKNPLTGEWARKVAQNLIQEESK